MERNGRSGKDAFTPWVENGIIEVSWASEWNVDIRVLESAAVGGLAVERNAVKG